MNDKAVLSLALQDVEGRVITEARVELSRAGETEVTPLRFDERQGFFVSEPVDPGRYLLTVDAAGYVTETVRLRLTPPGVTTTLMLGREGQPYYVVAGSRVYYHATDLMAAMMRVPAEGQPLERAEQAMRAVGAVTVEHVERLVPGQVMIVTFPREAAARALQVQSEREMPEVIDAGPVVYARGSDVRFLSREIEVVTEDGVTRERLERLLAQFGLHVLWQARQDPRIYVVAPEGMPDIDHGSMPERLMELPEIREARSQIAKPVRTLAINPADALFPLQFHSILTRLPDAWEKVRSPASAESFGSADIIVAVSDSGIQTATAAGVSTASHPAFSGTVTGGTLTALIGANKLVDAFDFNSSPMARGNDTPTASHGSWVAGVISAPRDAHGVVGTAANTRLASYMFPPFPNAALAETFGYYAGINPEWLQGGAFGAGQPFPFLLGSGGRIVPGAAIINASHSGPSLITNVYERILLRSTLFGRDRRGTVIFAAAGNEDRDLRSEAWAETTNVIRVAATTLDVRGEEVRMNFSSFSVHGDHILDFCAPSESANALPTVHEPPHLYGFMTVARTTTSGDLPSTEHLRRNISNAPSAGDTLVEVAPGDFAVFAAGQTVIIRDKLDPLHAEVHTLAAPTGPNRLNLGMGRRLGFSYPAGRGEIIRLTGDNAYERDFGGTSAATPQAAAIAALMLSVKPTLTWLEVRQIMRDTAVPVALRYRGSTYPTGPAHRYRWRDAANHDLIDADGLLDIVVAGPDRTITAATNPGTRVLPLNSSAGIAPRQALLIGAETKLDGAHPRATATELQVEGNASFENGDTIFIGRDVQTVLIRAGFTGDRRIWVQSVDGIEPGDMITITSPGGITETVQATSILRFTASPLTPNVHFTGDAETGFNIPAPGLANNHVRGAIVTLSTAHTEGPFTVMSKTGGNILNLDSAVTRAHPHHRMVRKQGTEVRAVIRRIPPNSVEIDPLHNAHPVNEHVAVGRIAHYGLGFGYGRLDAMEAVEAAKNYTHDERDLMVRNFKDDDGKTNVGAREVESFDLWVRNDAASPVGLAYDQCPHQTPEITVDPAIHIGSGRNDLQVSGTCTSAAEVTFVIEIDHTGATDTFKWSRNGAGPTAGVAITAGAAQALTDGVSIQFAAGTGHDLGDKWIVRARQITNRFAHIRVRNRGNQNFFIRSTFTPLLISPNALDQAQRRLLLCVSEGYPVARFVSVAAVPGPNDLEVTAAYTGANPRALFTIEITATAAAGDTFTWYRDGVVKPAVVIAAGMNHPLEAGVTIRFGSHTGHQVGDRWNLYARSGPDAFLNLDHYWDSDVPPAAGPPPAELFDPSTGRSGTRALLIDAVNGLAAGASEIHSADWPEALRPPTNNPNTARPLPADRRRFFLLGETVPHDGALMGFTAKTNNNITFREIVFAKFRFSQDDGAAPLDTAIDVDNTGIATTKVFRVEVRTTCGTFRAEKVRLRFTGKKGAAPEEKVVWHHSGSWQWDALILWPVANEPREARRPDGSQPVASGEQFDMSFDCLITVDKSFTEVTVEAEIVSEFRDHAVAVGKHTFTIFQMAPLPLGTGAAQAATLPSPKSFVFADMAPLSQTAQQTFGPVVDPADANATTNRYRATALLTAASEVKAYAVTSGLVAIQHNATDDTVNLFLRPLRQPIARLTPVKYFVYRGLKRTDWLKPTDPKLIRDEAGSPPFLSSVWPTFKTQNPGETDMPATVFGYDDTQPGTDLLDDIFFRVGATKQLPLAIEGIELGKFDHTKPFGFEIVIEEGDYSPTLAYARKASYEIDITGLPSGTPAEQFARRIKQEEILNFLDPAAFYGLHLHPGGAVRAPGGITHKNQDIHTNIVSKFLTRNQLYIDIRNENGGSLNFQRNYDVGGNQLQRGLTAGALTAQPYATSGWPIVSFDNNTFATTLDDFSEIHLQLPRNDNENPVLYLAHGQLLVLPDTPFLRGTVLNDTGSWTKTVSFRVPNTGVNPTKVATAWILRLFYGRLDVAVRTVAIPNTVLKTLEYTDNVFGPIDRAPKWKGTSGIKWVTTQDNRYVDANADRGWRQMMQSGLAVQTSGTAPRVLLYAIATARDIDPTAAIDFAPVRSMPGGVSDKKSFFSEPGLFGIYQLEIDQTHDGANIVRTLQLQQAPKDGYAPSSALLLGLTQVELDALLALGPGLDKSFRTLILDTRTAIADPNRPADRWRVGVQGLKTADGQFDSVFPTAGNEIFVYTVDGQLFASKAFADAEPLPTTYARNYEEALGARDWPQRERQIAAVTTVAPKTITIKNYDWTEEVLPNGKIRIAKSAAQNGEKDVTGVTFNGTDTIITVTGSLNSTAPLGSAFTLVKKFEDRMIDLDQGAALGGFEKTRTLVDSFVTAVTGIANNAGAKAAIQTRIDDEGAKILGRARARAEAERARAEDHERTLYWARNRLVVAVKSHPFCLGSISARNELLLRLEKKSRGYEPDFAGAGGARKVLLTGFDPFMLDTKLDRSNPSAAVALALHGTTVSGTSKSAFVQSAIFPVRYRDFDAGRVEELVTPRLSGGGKVDMIMTISQNGDSPFYDLERFAGRLRGGWYDNERVTQKPQALPTGNEFYETTLPADDMVPGPFATPPDDEQKLFFDQSFKGPTTSFRAASQAIAPGENTNTPTAVMTGAAIEGSGGNYLSNEIMYRVARERDKPPGTTTITGHLHIPSPAEAKVGIADVIAEVETLIKRWLDGLP